MRDERKSFDEWFRRHQCIAPSTDTTFISSAFLPYAAWIARANSSWISCKDRMPDAETEVLVVVKGQQRIGILLWEEPNHEDTFKRYQYWSNADDDKFWEHDEVTHWQPLQELPKDLHNENQ